MTATVIQPPSRPARHAPHHGFLGSEINPIYFCENVIDHDALPWGNHSYLWVLTPNGQLTKCYYSYADYCMD
jgi:hypothetical protein